MIVEVITPEKIILSQDGVLSVTLPTLEGEITLLENHIPLVAAISPGELTIRRKDSSTNLAVLTGYADFRQNKLRILTDYAIRSEDIETAKVEEARRQAEKAMSEKTNRADFLVAEAELKKSLLELKVAAKRRKPSV